MSEFSKNKYDLEERTAKFAEDVIVLMRKLQSDSVNDRLIRQVVASAGSVGANYCEANKAESRKDFIHKIYISKKEIKETKHWLRLIAKANPDYGVVLRELWQEAQELLLIFSKIAKSAKDKNSTST